MKSLLPLAGLLVTGFAANTLGQQSRQLFEAPAIVLPASRSYDALADLDGDGFVDAIESQFIDDGGGSGHQRIVAHRNDGSGKLVPGFTFDWSAATGNANTSVRVVAANFDGNSRRDFAVLAGTKLGFFLSNGAAVPTLLGTSDVPNVLTELSSADFDANGTDDIAVRTTESGASIRVYDAVMSGVPSDYVAIAFPAGQITNSANRSLIPLDITGDGKPEILTVAIESNPTPVTRVRAFVHSGAALFPVGNWSLTNPGAFSTIIVPGNVDANGTGDFVAYFASNQYQVVRRTSPGTLVLDPVRVGPPAHELIDLNGDGYDDAVGVNVFATGQALAPLSISFNDQTGTFDSQSTWQCSLPRNFAGVADLDHDGDLDIVAGRNIFYARGPWQQAKGAPVVPVGAPSIDQTRFLDLDGDGDLDAYSHRDSYLRNRGDGTFELASRVTPPLPLNTFFTSAGFSGDVDGDGDIDLVVHHLQNGSNGILSERLLKSNGAGGFVDGGAITSFGVVFDPLPSVDQPVETAVTFVDVDDDGDQDAIASHETFSGSFVAAYRNTGGMFTGFQSSADGATNSDRIGDIDGDGYVDIVTARSFNLAAPVNVRFGSVVGFSVPTTISAVASNVTDLFIVDLDEDGDRDIVYSLGSFNDQYVYWAENLGYRQFTLHTGLVTPSQGFHPSHLRVVDVDRDSHVDLVLANDYNAKTTSVLFGSGAPGADFTLSDTSYAIESTALADLDGDGDVESIATDRTRGLLYAGAEHGRHLQFGSATPGAFGQSPILGASGELRVGQTAAVRVRGMSPGAPGGIFVGLSKASNPPLVAGGVFYPFPFSIFVALSFPGSPTEFGSGGITLPYVVPPGVFGVKWYQQAASLDASNPFGVVWTNAIEIEYGP